MAKFLAIYHTPVEAMTQMANASEADKMKGMQVWLDWKEKYGSMITDLGTPLKPGIETGNGSDWSSSNTLVSGYSIVEADSLERAKAIFENHPHVGWHPEAKIHVHEMMPM